MEKTMQKTVLTLINTTQNEIFSKKYALLATLKIALCFIFGLLAAYMLIHNGVGFFGALVPVAMAWAGVIYALSCYDDEINADDDISIEGRPSPFFLRENALRDGVTS